MFPCRPGGPPEGRPLRAQHCVCSGPRPVIRGSCSRCGRWAKRTVDETFAVQARREARGQRNVYDLDEFRTRRQRMAA